MTETTENHKFWKWYGSYELKDLNVDVRIMVSRSHQGDVMKMAEKFKPPGVVTPAGGSGYKVTLDSSLHTSVDFRV